MPGIADYYGYSLTLSRLSPPPGRIASRFFSRVHMNMSRLIHISWLAVLAVGGCTAIPTNEPPVVEYGPSQYDGVPRELAKVVLPRYQIEPPDILVIEAVNVVPKPPYRLRTGDVVSVQSRGALPDAPIDGPFVVEPGGLVNLGPPYGTLKIAGLTSEEAQTAVDAHLRNTLQAPLVSVGLLQMSNLQQIAGPHLVGPDGTVNLGTYGSVQVAGLTVEDAKRTIEQYLSQHLENPEVSVDVFAFNSKVYYVCTQGAGLGDNVTRFPVTGNETVLDAISNVNGLSQVSSKKIWIARPSPYNGELQILPVDWEAITAQGMSATNYQIMPGDRIFVAEDKWVAFDTRMAKFLAPAERLFGFGILGTTSLTRFSGKVLRGGGNPQGGNIF